MLFQLDPGYWTRKGNIVEMKAFKDKRMIMGVFSSSTVDEN